MKYNIENLDDYIIKYLIKWFQAIYDNKLNISEKIVIIFLHIFHIIVILFNFLGAFLPPKLLKIYIFFTMMLLSSWYIFGKCMILFYTYQIDKRDYDFLPLNNKTRLIILGVFFTWAIIGILSPNLSLFRISKFIINSVNKNINIVAKIYD
jgi:hypothetical protein